MMKSTRVVKCLAMMGLISCVAVLPRMAEADDAYCRWLFEANPSINAGSASGVSLNLGNGVTLHDGYAAFQAVSGKAGETSGAVNLSGAQAITVSFFLRNPVHSDTSTVLLELSDNYNDAPGRFYIGHSVESDADKISACFHIGPGDTANYSNVDAKGLQLRDGQWHHIAIVYRTGCDYPKQTAIYVDGTNVTLSTRTGSGKVVENKPTTGVTFSSADTLYVCGRAGAAARTMDLADLSIFKRELTVQEVRGLFAGFLFVEQADDALGASSPAVGVHQGYQAGDVVPFSWTKADESANEELRGWTLWTNDVENANAWGVWKRGFGNCGSFVHNGGMVRLTWTTVVERLIGDYHWMLDASPSINMGPSDVKMTFGEDVAVSSGYAAFTGQGTSCAVSSSAIDLGTAPAVTLAFMLRNPVKGDKTGILVEQSADYNNVSGSFLIVYANDESKGEQLSLNLRYKVGSGYSLCTANNLCLHDGKWHKIVVIFRKAAYLKNMALYVDGVAAPLTNSDTDPGHQCNTTDMTFANDKFYLGGRNGKGWVAADLKGFAIYKRELSVAEMQGYPGDWEGSLLTTAKGDGVTGAHLPIASFGSQCAISEGDVLSFTFANDPLYSLSTGRPKKLASWTVYRQIGNAWESYLTGTEKSFEFTNPGGNLKLELDFVSPGFAVLLK